MREFQNYKCGSERFCSLGDFREKPKIWSKVAKIGVVVPFQLLVQFKNKPAQNVQSRFHLYGSKYS